MPLDALVEDIVAIAQTPAPTFAEEPRLAWLERRLAGAPGRRARDGAGNLVWRWGDGAPRVLVTAHVDTVFGPETDLAVRREDGALVGPGVGDNAAAVAAAVHVVSSLLERGGDMAAGAVAFTVGEEGPGNLRGASHACDALRPAAVVALEGHWLDRVVVDAVGSARARLVVRGPGGHSWDDRDRPSALHALVDLAARVVALGGEGTPVNIGRFAGGGAVNAIAAAAELEVEMRATEEPPLDAFCAALRELAGGAQDGLRAEVQTIGRRPPGALERDSGLLAAVRAVRGELGLADRLAAGSTDAAAALQRAIPALCLGMTTGSGMHTPEERIDIAPLEAGCLQLERLLLRLLSRGSDSLR